MQEFSRLAHGALPANAAQARVFKIAPLSLFADNDRLSVRAVWRESGWPLAGPPGGALCLPVPYIFWRRC
jgi:hypothetical protein